MCGIVGIIGSSQASTEAFLSLTTLQHRGQDAAGILSYDKEGFHRVRHPGLVEAAFTRESIESLPGNIALGHNRYSTIGRKGDTTDIQPFLESFPFGIGIVHNGNIVNQGELDEWLKTKAGRRRVSRSDTEVILHLLAHSLSVHAPKQKLSFSDIVEAMGFVFGRLNGAYSVVAYIADTGLLAFRDPHGIRPLVLGRNESGSHMLASETVALEFNGYTPIRDIAPGEVVLIDEAGEVHAQVVAQSETRHCMFEWVYFASTESVLDDAPVYTSRLSLGEALSEQIREEMESGRMRPDIVAPVPETARGAAISLSEKLGIPYREVLIKNRYIKRTFILEDDASRRRAVHLKLSPVRREIAGKSVLLIDDSIVRGTTSRHLIEHVRRAGAKEVYFVSTCPPIRHPCYYGLDFPSSKELVASDQKIEAIEKELGADRVIFLKQNVLNKAIGTAHGTLCMACLDGNYPTDVSEAEQFTHQRLRDRNASQ